VRSPTGYRLLVALVKNRGKVLTQSALLELAWGDPLRVGLDRVKYSVMRLRRKIGRRTGPDSRIEAVRGFGYRYG
jgi:DNA-binding response OmpR family regulator